MCFVGHVNVQFAGLLSDCQYVLGSSCHRPFRHRFSWLSSIIKQMLMWFKLLQFSVFKLIRITSCISIVLLYHKLVIKSKFHCISLKLLHSTTLWYSLPYYPYQQDKRAKPGNLLIIRFPERSLSHFSPSTYSCTGFRNSHSINRRLITYSLNSNKELENGIFSSFCEVFISNLPELSAGGL